MRIVTPEQMKKLEALADKNGISYSMLMENAGKCLADEIQKISEERHNQKNILFLCGSGNNAGDCFVAGRHLLKDGWKVKFAMLCGEPSGNIAADAYVAAKGIKSVYNAEEIKKLVKNAAVIADGVFGTGFHGELSRGVAEIFDMPCSAVRIAVDVPSGGSCLTGLTSEGTFKADYTITFAYKKFGVEQYPLKSFCGKIIVCDIGIPDEYCNELECNIQAVTEEMVFGMLPKRKPDSHKGTYGRLLCVTGSIGMPGAAILSGRAALRCGVGLVGICAPKKNICAMAAAMPEAVYLPLAVDENGFYKSTNAERILKESRKANAMLIGCGLGVNENTKALVRELIKNSDCPVILDADGINCIIDCIDIIKEARSDIVLTPHPAEMARLIGKRAFEVQADRLNTALKFTEEYNAVRVLKGAGTITVCGKSEVYVNPTGNSGMSKGGSGDVLSGMLAAFAAQGISLRHSAMLTVFIHGMAGDRAARKLSMQSMLPSDLINELPPLFSEIEKK